MFRSCWCRWSVPTPSSTMAWGHTANAGVHRSGKCLAQFASMSVGRNLGTNAREQRRQHRRQHRRSSKSMRTRFRLASPTRCQKLGKNVLNKTMVRILALPRRLLWCPTDRPPKLQHLKLQTRSSSCRGPVGTRGESESEGKGKGEG
jgi:hypothetical protein